MLQTPWPRKRSLLFEPEALRPVVSGVATASSLARRTRMAAGPRGCCCRNRSSASSKAAPRHRPRTYRPSPGRTVEQYDPLLLVALMQELRENRWNPEAVEGSARNIDGIQKLRILVIPLVSGHLL